MERNLFFAPDCKMTVLVATVTDREDVKLNDCMTVRLLVESDWPLIRDFVTLKCISCHTRFAL